MEREWFHLSDNDIDNIINEYGFIRVRNSVKAVSYTHLDVYKRQLLYRTEQAKAIIDIYDLKNVMGKTEKQLIDLLLSDRGLKAVSYTHLNDSWTWAQAAARTVLRMMGR